MLLLLHLSELLLRDEVLENARLVLEGGLEDLQGILLLPLLLVGLRMMK